MEILRQARILADYVAEHWPLPPPGNYGVQPASDNIGAILVDAVFQAGLNYRSVVLPRVRAIEAHFPNLRTLNRLERLLDAPEFTNALRWNHPEKPRRLRHLVRFLRKRGLDTLEDIQGWIVRSSSCVGLLELKGIGPKTVDYLKILLGIPVIAVDRHAFGLLRSLGIKTHSYLDAKRVMEFAADLLDVSRWVFDKIVWEAMSNARRGGHSFGTVLASA
jgi:hypothetical protein